MSDPQGRVSDLADVVVAEIYACGRSIPAAISYSRAQSRYGYSTDPILRYTRPHQSASKGQIVCRDWERNCREATHVPEHSTRIHSMGDADIGQTSGYSDQG